MLLICAKHTITQKLPLKVYKKSTIIKIKTSQNSAVLVYCIFKKIQIDNKPIKAGTVCKILIIIFFAVFVLLFLSKYISYEDYQMVLGVSESHENLGATSAIVDLIPVNGNLGLFMLIYVINAVRMMIPVELLTNGVFYVPFVLFQVFHLALF